MRLNTFCKLGRRAGVTVTAAGIALCNYATIGDVSAPFGRLADELTEN
jgi:hypothetical protein